MKINADFAVALVALLHLGFLVVEMFFWERPLGLRIFGPAPETAAATQI